jgi:murein DD-endopeptidase MepM/ murein hydrolase activator NlpD
MISSDVGYRTDPMGGAEDQLHKGTDYAAKEGTPVYAVLPGRVIAHWPEPGRPYPGGGTYKGDPVYGGRVDIDHGPFISISGHMLRTNVVTGQRVEAGDIIGWVGSTGKSTGPHLHFEIVISPMRYLEER